MPQTSKDKATDVTIPVPLMSGATDNPDAPQPPTSGKILPRNISTNQDDLFPLLSKSPGFKEAMSKADLAGEADDVTTLPPAMVMMRNLRTLEGSELYKGATPRQRVLMQQAFYKKYVVPAQRAANYKGSFDEWIKDRGTHWQYQVNPASQDKAFGGLIPGGGTKKEISEGLYKRKAGMLDIQRTAKEAASKEGIAAGAGGIARTNLDIAKTLDDARRAAMFHFQNISRELSFGNAMLNAQISPHMGPIIMDPHYREVRKDGTTQQIRQLIKDDDYFAVNGYRQSTVNKMMRGTGRLVGDVPWFLATDGIASLSAEALGVTETAKTAVEAKKVLSLTPYQNIGARAVGNAAQGYVIGTLEGDKDPAKTAMWFGITSATLGTGGHVIQKGMISPAAKYLGSVFGWGGGKLTNELANEAEKAVISKAPHATVSPISIAMAGNKKQKISASFISALNNLTNGDFSKAPSEAKRVALAKLMQVAPEFAEQIAYIDKTVIASEAAQNLVSQREAVPEFNEFLAKLEKASNQPTHMSVADAAQQNSHIEIMRRSSDRWVQEMFQDPTIRESIQKDIAKYGGPERRGMGPGAAYANSLEFGDNLTKHVDKRLEEIGLGKNALQFETRADKLLFYLNVAQAELMQKGISPAREKEFQFLMNKLQEEFPGEKGSLPNLLKMSDKVWSDMEQATSAGLFREGEIFRYWRQHSRPGESPFAHEVELLQQAQRAEARGAEELQTELAGKPPAEVKAPPVKDADDDKLKAAFAKHGDTGATSVDKAIHAKVVERMFPGQRYDKLTPAEQSEVNQIAAAISKGMKKGKP
jgi:hypothetical protein